MMKSASPTATHHPVTSVGMGRSKKRYWPGALMGMAALLALFAVFGNRLWFDRMGLSKATTAGHEECAVEALENGKGGLQLDDTGERLQMALRCLEASTERTNSVRGDHAAHVLSAVRKEAHVAQELVRVASDLAREVLELAGRHENVVLRDQLTMLKNDLMDSQQDYRRCIASHSQESAGAIHRGYKFEQGQQQQQRQQPGAALQDARFVARETRKKKLLSLPGTSTWLLLESLVPAPLEPFDIVYAFPGGTTKRNWSSLAASIRSVGAHGARLRYGTVFVLLGAGESQAVATENLRGLSAHFIQGDFATNLAHFREHFVVLSDDVLFWQAIERAAFWERTESWGPRVAFGAKACSNKLTDALLDNVVMAARTEPRPCLTLQPMALNKSILLHLIRSLVGPLPISNVRNCCDGAVDLVHLFAHWMLEHNLLGKSTQDSRDLVPVGDLGVSVPLAAPPLFVVAQHNP